MTDLAGLDKILKAKAKKLRKQSSRAVGQIGIGIMTDVAKRTPVDTGRARYNWQMSKNVPINASLLAPSYGGRGAALTSISRAVPVARSYVSGRDKSLHITNNLVYIEPLNQGHSKQAPAGYVQQAVVSGVAKVNFKEIFAL